MTHLPPADLDRDDVRLLRAVTFLLRNWRRIFLWPAVVSVLLGGVLFLTPRHFTVTVSFLPTAGADATSTLGGLAAQFGVSLPTDAPGSSPAFYVELVSGASVRRALAEHQYLWTQPRPWWRGGGREDRAGPLWAVLDLAPANDSVRGRVEAARFLAEAVSARATRESGTVTVSIRTRYPALSAQIGEQLLLLLNRFNQEVRHTQATEERKFVEGRLGQAREDLRSAEDRLQGFLQRNRSVENSPELLLERDRLTREVQLRQEVVTTLAQSYEKARIDEVRNTPVVTTLDPPRTPEEPDRRGLALKLVAAFCVLALTGAGWAMAAELLASGRRASPVDASAMEAAVARLPGRGERPDTTA